MIGFILGILFVWNVIVTVISVVALLCALGGGDGCDRDCYTKQ